MKLTEIFVTQPKIMWRIFFRVFRFSLFAVQIYAHFSVCHEFLIFFFALFKQKQNLFVSDQKTIKKKHKLVWLNREPYVGKFDS